MTFLLLLRLAGIAVGASSKARFRFSHWTYHASAVLCPVLSCPVLEGKFRSWRRKTDKYSSSFCKSCDPDASGFASFLVQVCLSVFHMCSSGAYGLTGRWPGKLFLPGSWKAPPTLYLGLFSPQRGNPSSPCSPTLSGHSGKQSLDSGPLLVIFPPFTRSVAKSCLLRRRPLTWPCPVLMYHVPRMFCLFIFC